MALAWKKNDCHGYDATHKGRLVYEVVNRKYGWYLIRYRADGSTSSVEPVRSMKAGKEYAETLHALTANGARPQPGQNDSAATP